MSRNVYVSGVVLTPAGQIVLRIGIGICSGLCTAVIASLVLYDHNNLPLLSTAAFSLLRFSKPDTLYLLPELTRAVRFSTPTKIPRLLGYTMLALVIFILTIFFQFAATVLLGDMQAVWALLVARPESISIAPGSSEFVRLTSDVWLTPLTENSFPRLGIVEKVAIEGKWGERWDTGMTMQALLPFHSLEAYNTVSEVFGPLPVLSSRHACALPSNFNSSLSREPTSSSDNPAHLYLTGTATAPSIFSDSLPQMSFNCALAIRQGPAQSNDIPISICTIEKVRTSEDTGGLTESSTTFTMLLTVEGKYPEWDLYYNSMLEYTNSTSSGVLPLHPKGGWMELANTEGGNLRLSVTMCVSELSLTPTLVTVSTSEKPLERSSALVWDPASDRYDTKDARELFSPVTSSRYKYEFASLLPPPLSNPSMFGWLLGKVSLMGKGTGILCLTCLPSATTVSPRDTSHTFPIHPAKTQLLQDTLRTTGNPALLLHTLSSLLVHELYQDAVPFYNISEEFEISRFVRRPSPRGRKGYAVLMSMLLLYMLLVVGQVGVFFSRIGMSSGHPVVLGNSWYAIADVVRREETRDVTRLAMVSGMTDQKLREQFGPHGRRYQAVSSGRIGRGFEGLCGAFREWPSRGRHAHAGMPGSCDGWQGDGHRDVNTIGGECD